MSHLSPRTGLDRVRPLSCRLASVHFIPSPLALCDRPPHKGVWEWAGGCHHEELLGGTWQEV